MDKKLIETLFTTLDEIMRTDGNWQEKARRIRSEASDQDEVNLDEFVSWFNI